MAWPNFIFIFVMPGANDLSAQGKEIFVSLVEERRWAEAVKFYEVIWKKDPDCLPAVNALAKVAYENRDFTAAFGLLSSLVKNYPGNPIWLNNLGVVAAGCGDFVVARGLLQQAIMVSGGRSEVLYNLGCLAVNENNKDSALKIFSQIISVEPGHLRALFALSRIAKELGRVDEAITYCRKLVELVPNEAEFRQNLGILLLKTGDWEAGFKLYESRWQANRLEQFPVEFLWQGEDLSKKTILVWSEQGLGDTINFVRYLPQLKKLAGSVVLVVQEALLELLRTSFPDITIMGLSERGQVVYDVQVPLLNLPRFFSTRPDDLEPVEAYLQVSEEFQEKWCSRLVTDRACFDKDTYSRSTPALEKDSRLRVGVVWAGNPNHANDLNRSISLKLFSRIFAVLEGVSFYSLQKEQVAGEEKLIVMFTGAEEGCRKFTDLSGELNDFQDTAAILQNLDLLISCDTSVAHLAGALSCPTWLLLPFDADWRWLLNCEDSPWYPSMRLFRQSEPGSWGPVIDKVCCCLQGTVESRVNLTAYE